METAFIILFICTQICSVLPMTYVTILPVYPSEYLLANNMTEYLRNFKRFAVSPPVASSNPLNKHGNDTRFTNSFEYWAPKAYGTFLNISYSEVYLKLSTRTSMLYLLTEHCASCDRNSIYHLNSSSSFRVFKPYDDSCWSNTSYPSAKASLPQPNYYDSCYISLDYKFGQFYNSLVGSEAVYLNGRQFIASSILYAINNNYAVTNESLDGAYDFSNPIADDINPRKSFVMEENITGILGIGPSDLEGSYGHTLLDDMLTNEIISSPIITICIQNHKGYMLFGATYKGSFSGDIPWFPIRNPFHYTVDIGGIKLNGASLSSEGHLLGALAFDLPFIYLPAEIISNLDNAFANQACSGASVENKLICNWKTKFTEKDSSISVKFSDLDSVLMGLPSLSFDITSPTREQKEQTVTINNILRICPSPNVNYVQMLNDYLLGKNTTEPVLPICSIIRVLPDHDRKKFSILLGAPFLNNKTIIIDRTLGKVGFGVNGGETSCQIGDLANAQLDTFEYIDDIILLVNIIALCLTLIVIIVAITQCDKYLIDEPDGENANQFGGNAADHSHQQN